jgi:rhodanese-related sulfurtransferase
MNKIKICISLIVVILILGVSCINNQKPGNDTSASTSASPKNPRSISAKKAYAMMKNDDEIILVDTRTKAEYTDAHIEKAVFIDSFSKTLKEDLKDYDKDATYILYCWGGKRSKIVQKKMVEFGFKNVYEIEDGMLGWKEGKLPVVASSE